MSIEIVSLPVRFRYQARHSDEAAVRAVVAATGFFSAPEVDIAAELVAERLSRGEESGYDFVFADGADGLAGYTCFGPVPATEGSFDLYWIAAHPALQGQGLGRKLLERTLALVAERGGRVLWIETSSRPQYAPTRAFYERCGCQRAADLADFYAPGDGKVIYCVRPPAQRT